MVWGFLIYAVIQACLYSTESLCFIQQTTEINAHTKAVVDLQKVEEFEGMKFNRICHKIIIM